jgi:hypothetical protein
MAIFMESVGPNLLKAQLVRRHLAQRFVLCQAGFSPRGPFSIYARNERVLGAKP